MSDALADATQRFSDRVADYVRHRPGYPESLLNTLEERAGLSPDSVVADIGSGTGISSELFLRFGCSVFGVEPNAGMRQAAESRLAGYVRFRAIDGSAERTTLPASSVDVVAAAQAFHWFDVEAAREEFARILRQDGHVCLFWNRRRHDDTPFARAYEELLQRYGTDYSEVSRRTSDATRLARFFAGSYERHVFPNAQSFDWEGVKGRLMSSSYAPAPGHPDHEPMLNALQIIFRTHAENGQIGFGYDTELFVGRVRNAILRPDHT